MPNSRDSSHPKISPALAARLAELLPEDVVRVVVLLNVPAPAANGRRLTAVERTTAVAAAKEATEQLWRELHPTLDETHASRVDTGGASALGGIVLDLPAQNVSALAASEQVRAVFDDQQLVPPRV